MQCTDRTRLCLDSGHVKTPHSSGRRDKNSLSHLLHKARSLIQNTMVSRPQAIATEKYVWLHNKVCQLPIIILQKKPMYCGFEFKYPISINILSQFWGKAVYLLSCERVFLSFINSVIADLVLKETRSYLKWKCLIFKTIFCDHLAEIVFHYVIQLHLLSILLSY